MISPHCCTGTSPKLTLLWAACWTKWPAMVLSIPSYPMSTLLLGIPRDDVDPAVPHIYTENQTEKGISALQKSQKIWLEGLSGGHIIQFLWDHHQHEIRFATVFWAESWNWPTIWSVLQLDSWKKTCQKSLGMLSLWHLTWTKFTTGTLLLAKSPPSCHFLVTSQFKSKISLDNPCWWYHEKSI